MLSENWMMDNFNSDPNVGKFSPMISTAENVAKAAGITKEEVDELAAHRWSQYEDALADDRAFQRGYFFPIVEQISKKKTITLEADEGVTPSKLEVLQGLRPVMEGGVHSFGAQTHPADGNGFLIVTTEEKARELAADPGVTVKICSYGFARVDRGFMPKAPLPAAKDALSKAGISLDDVKVIKTHNPFTVNDLYFAKELGIDAKSFNNYGSPLIFGHPQGPTAGRCVMELIEELAGKGGGYGLFTGCAAGDTGAAMVIKVDAA